MQVWVWECSHSTHSLTPEGTRHYCCPLPPSADTDIDCRIKTPLPESIKSLHGIDLAKTGKGGRREGTGTPSINWFLTFCAWRCQSFSFVSKPEGQTDSTADRYLLQTDYTGHLGCVRSHIDAKDASGHKPDCSMLPLSLRKAGFLKNSPRKDTSDMSERAAKKNWFKWVTSEAN